MIDALSDGLPLYDFLNFVLGTINQLPFFVCLEFII